MRKTIPVENVTVGMSIVGMDRSWLKTPFLRHRMQVTKEAHIEALKASGIRFVDVEIEKDGRVMDAALLPDVPAADALVVTTEQSAPGTSRVETMAFHDELGLARSIYQETKLVVKQALRDARMGKAINLDAVSEVVHRMTDSLLRHPQALTSLSRLKHFDEYTFYHSVNTAILALSLGLRLKMDPESWRWLGIGTLLHDIGKMKIAPELLNKPGRFTHDEYEVMKQHALRGVEILSAVGLPDKGMRPALEHHERVDGTGYPFQRKKHELTQVGLISSVVDIYDALTSDRVYHKGMTSHDALRYLYSLGLRGHLDSMLVQHFIQCVGVYPVGSCVVLNTGEVGVVSAVHQEHPLEPVVTLVRGAEGNPIIPARTVDLLAATESRARKIAAAIDAQQAGVYPNVHLDGMVVPLG
ncbi:MAG: HD-GYP domain-containing protein [Nitrospiraceae bacterium]